MDDKSDEEVMWCGTLLLSYPERIMITSIHMEGEIECQCVYANVRTYQPIADRPFDRLGQVSLLGDGAGGRVSIPLEIVVLLGREGRVGDGFSSIIGRRLPLLLRTLEVVEIGYSSVRDRRNM